MSIVLFLTIVYELNWDISLLLSLTDEAIRDIAFLVDCFSDILASLAFWSYGLAKFMHSHATIYASLDGVHSFIVVAKTGSTASF